MTALIPHTYGRTPGTMRVNQSTGHYALGGYGYMIPGTTTFSRLLLANNMVSAAEASTPLTAVSAAENRGYFSTAPSTDADAYYTAAYWTAVASRLLGSKTLAKLANDYKWKGTPTHLVSGTSLRSSKGAGVLSDAAKKVYAAAKSAGRTQDREVMTVVVVLRKLSSEFKGNVQRLTQAVATAPQAAVDAVKDAVIPSALREDSRAWKWALGIGGGLLALTIVGLAFRSATPSTRPHKQVANPFWRRKDKKQRIPWFAVIGLTVLAAGDAITPGFPFPGSAIIMVPLAAGAWLAKASEYGVQPKQLTAGE